MKCTRELHTLSRVKIDGVKAMLVEKFIAVRIVPPSDKPLFCAHNLFHCQIRLWICIGEDECS
jgi:hypothetical protein